MAICGITSRTGSPHVRAFHARQLVGVLGGLWPRRLADSQTMGDFEIVMDENDPMSIVIRDGVICSHGHVIGNDDVIFEQLTAASGSNYKKATVWFKCEYNEDGTDTAELAIAYSSEGATASSISYPVPGLDIVNPYIAIERVGWEFAIYVAHVLIQGSSIVSVENLIPVWDGKQFYTPGDELDLSYMIAAGYIAANSQNVYFFVPFNKDLCGVTSATLSGNVTLRHADGDFIGSSSGQALSSLGTVTIYLYPTGAYIRCVLSSASTLSNQSVISACLANGAKLTFH